MKRRHVLAAGSTLATASLAGCMGVLQPASDVEWTGDDYAAEDSDPNTEAALYFLGELTNTGGNHIETIELTITLVDENDQEITTRSKELSKIRVGTTQEFHFRYGTATPPVRIQARITDLDATHEFSKAGLTVRAEGDDLAPFGYVGVTGEHGSETTWRLDRDSHTHSRQFEERSDAFGWYRVEYDGATATCYLSPDGEDWRPVDQRSVDLGERIQVGLLVCSHSTEETAAATFTDVTVCRLDA